jgi:hypothetical protein
MEDLVRENDDGSDGSGYGSIDWEANTLLQSLPKHITIRWRSVCEESEIL